MGLTRISGDVIQTPLNVGVVTATGVNVGTAVTIHTSGFQIGSSDIHSTGISVRNVNSTGVVTATSFSGNVTGNLTGNVNSTGVSTFATANITQSNPTNLNVSGVSTFAGITTVTGPTLFAKQLNVSGVITATSFVGSGANLTGIAVTANVVTNSLVVSGMTTATGGIQVGSSFIRSTSIGIGTTTTTGRNAGVGTATGTIIFNSTTNSLEIYNSGWFQLQVASFLIDALVVAGGGTGGGPYGIGAGGGAGGVLYATNLPVNLGPYPLTIGAGGVATPTPVANIQNNGNPSNFGSYIADGGGYGGSYQSSSGSPGGSGGGSGSDLRGQPSATLSPAPSVGQATQTPQSPGNSYARMLGYGNRGGFATGDLPATPGAIKVAGGGGAGAVGTNGSPTGAPGGAGLTFTIPGSPLTVGGGGGSNGYGVPAGTGGPGGGGNGQPNPQPSVNGTANTGGGGGGGSYVTSNAGSGGSGLVVLKVPTMLTTTFSPGLTVSTSTSQPGYNTYTVTAGTGTVTFS